jgi:hypothetical protein
LTLQKPPIYEFLVESDGKAKLPWVLFFNSIASGDSGNSWNPNFENLTTVGVPTITGKYYALSSFLTFFSLTIIPETSTSSTAGTTYIDNFPLDFNNDGVCFAVTGNLGSVAGQVNSSNNRIYVPSWTAVSVPLTIVGIAEART